MKIVCEICKKLCITGAIFLKTGHVVCAICIYKKLGADHDNGQDWDFSILYKTAQELIDNL